MSEVVPRVTVVDASVAVKWYVPEPESALAAALLAEGSVFLAPDLIVAEFGNALWKKTRAAEVRPRELSPREAKTIVDAFVAAPPVRIEPSGPLVAVALDIAVEFGRTVYDALYLALAVVEDCLLVTADAALVGALEGTRLRRFIRLLKKTVTP